MSEQEWNLVGRLAQDGSTPVTEVTTRTDPDEPENPQENVHTTYRLPRIVHARVRRALSEHGKASGVGTLGELVERAIETELKRMEDEYNGGEPYEPAWPKLPTRRQP